MAEVKDISSLSLDETQEEEAMRKAAQKVVDKAVEVERKRRVSEMKEEISDQVKLATLDRLVTVQEQLMREANFAKAKKAAEEERLQRVQEHETAERKDFMQQELLRRAARKSLADEEEEERTRRIKESKEQSVQRDQLYDHIIDVQEELLKQFRCKMANLEEKHEQQRRETEDSKLKMQEQLLSKVHEKEIKKAVAEEQSRQIKGLSDGEIERRIAISDHLTDVHKELLSKRATVKPINPVMTHEVLEEIKLQMQEQLLRKANQKCVDAAMDEEKKRRVSESTEPSKEFDDKHTSMQEELTKKASIDCAKKAQKQALDEYMQDKQRSQAQEEAIRQANQKLADKMADAEKKSRVESTSGKTSPHIDPKLKEEICKASKN